MNKSTYVKIFSFALFCIFFTQLFSTPIQNESIDLAIKEDSLMSEKIISPNQAIDESTFLGLSFFQNITGLLEWIFTKIYDNTSVETQVRFFEETNRSGDVIIDGRHYFGDYAVFLDGIINFYESEIVIPSYLNYQHTAPFYDNNASSRGFYTWVSQDWTTNSTVKDFLTNAQVVLTFADWLIQENTPQNTYGADSIVNNQWNLLNDTFWDESTKTFNHSTSDSSKYMLDQFIAAICGFQIHRAQVGIEEATRLKANATATTIMNRMVNPSIFDATNTFITSKNKDFTGSANANSFLKDLTTNAYGIWALVEWYLESGGNAWDDLKLINASRVYNRLESLWNSTYKLYMSQTTQGFESIVNYSINLKDNAIMMMALKRLFEVTGNMTYFRRLMDMLDGIQTFFRDPIYGTYYKSIYPGDDGSHITNTNKSFSTHCYLFSALRRIATLSNYLTTTLFTNTSRYIHSYDNAFIINTSISFRFTNLNPNFPNLIKTAKLENATTFLTFRYPNETLIWNNTYNSSDQGYVNVSLPLENSYPVGQYSVSVRFNYTGLFSQFNTTYFSLISGISVKNYTVLNEIYCGDTQNLNLSINSTRLDNISVSVKITGDSIVNKTYTNQNIINQSINNLVYSLETLNETKFGNKTVLVEIFFGSLLYAQSDLTFKIVNPIKMILLSNPTTVFRGKTFNLSINMQNLVLKDQNLSIKVSGDDLITQTIANPLSGSQNAIILMIINVTATADYGKTRFLVNITRNSDGEVYYAEWIEIEVVPLVSILAVQKPETAGQGEQCFVIVKLQNNLVTNQIIQFSIDNGEKTSVTVIPGVNFVKIMVGDGFSNPYQFGIELFELTIVDSEGTEVYFEIISINVGFSFYGTFVGYALPIIIPLLGVIVFRYLDLENKKRLA